MRKHELATDAMSMSPVGQTTAQAVEEARGGKSAKRPEPERKKKEKNKKY
jgi:hypothetical protein